MSIMFLLCSYICMYIFVCICVCIYMCIHRHYLCTDHIICDRIADFFFTFMFYVKHWWLVSMASLKLISRNVCDFENFFPQGGSVLVMVVPWCLSEGEQSINKLKCGSPPYTSSVLSSAPTMYPWYPMKWNQRQTFWKQELKLCPGNVI